MKIADLRGFDINKSVHAYLIVSSGLSARKYAELLSTVLVCEQPSHGEPCGKCSACIKANAGTHPDIAVLGRDKVSVADIREMKGNVYLASNESDRKIFILEGIERFNKQSQNALLKVLEEPPSGVVFILTAAAKSSVLPTVLSRACVLTPDSHGFSYYTETARATLGDKADEADVDLIASYLNLYEDTDIDSLDTEAVKLAYASATEFFSGRNTNILSMLPKKREAAKESSDDAPVSKAKQEAARKEANSRSRGGLAVFLRTFMLTARNVAVYKQSGGKCSVKPGGEDFRKLCVRLSAKRAIYYYELFEKAYLLSEGNTNPNALYAYIAKNV